MLPGAGSLFLIFASQFLKFTPFFRNYKDFKCKSANLCNKKCQKLGNFNCEKLLPPRPIFTHPLPSGWENPEDSLSPRSIPLNLFASDQGTLIILSE